MRGRTLSRRIAELRHRARQSRRIPVAAAFLLLGLLAGTTYLASAHPITVDGTTADWFARAPLADDTAIVARNASEQGEHIWLDRTGDARTMFATPDSRVDITRTRFTGTTTDLNVLVQVADLDQTTGDGAAQLQLALDVDRVPGSGQTDFVVGADTQVANAVRWERLVQTRLGSGGGNAAVWSTSTGPPAFAGTVAAVGGSADAIELSVPWSALGLAGPPAAFNATVALFRSGTDDTTKEAPGSDALDVVSDYGDPGAALGTDAEVGDGTVDHFASVHLTSLGEARGPLVVSAFGANTAGNAAAEWIEVANATGATINISGFKLGDATTPGAPEAMFTFPAGTQLVGGQRFKVARSGAAFLAKFGSLPDAEFESTSAAPDMSPFAPWSAGALDLDDVGDELVILDGSNTTVDVVPYGTGAYTGVGTLAAPAVDAVLQRNPSLRDTDEAADFSTSTCAGTKTWDGGAGTASWHDANNWNPNGVPGAADHVCIDNTAHAAIVFSTGTTSVLSVTSGETLNVTGGTLTLTSATQQSTLDAFNLSGGTIAGAGNLVVNGPATWTNGQFTATATTVKTIFNGPLALNNGDHQLQFRQVELNGETTWAAGRILVGGGAAITNTAGHTFSIQTDDDFQFWFAPGSAFNNAGTVTKVIDGSAANDTTTVIDNGIAFNNTGSATAVMGTLETDGGGVSSGSFTAGADGGLVFGGSSNITTILSATSSVTGSGSVRFAGGTANVNGTYTNTGPLAVSGGTATFGTAFGGNALTASGGTLVLNQPSTASSLTLSGATIQGSANLTVDGPSTWSNGGFAADSTAVKTIFNGPLTMNGTEHQLQVRRLDVNANATWTSARFLVGASASIVNGEGSTFAFQTDDDFQFWFGSASSFTNLGTVTKEIDGNLANDTTTVVDGGIAFHNGGTASVLTGTLQTDGGGISTGAFSVAAGAGLVFSGSSAVVTNLNAGSSIGGAGSVRFAGGTTNVNGTYPHTGAVSITGGTAVFAPALNNNPLTASGGTLVLNSASSVPSLTLSGATIQGAGNLTVSGPTGWSSGGFSADSTAVKTIFNGPLTLNGTEHQLQVRQLEINADAVWTSARFLIGGGATVTNASGSTFAIQTDDDFQFWFGPATAFNNAGTVTKVVDANGANGTVSTVDSSVAFNNSGTATVLNGTLELSGGGASTGAFSVPAGSTLQLSGGTNNLNAGSTLNAAGLVRFTGGTTNVVGAYEVTSPTEVTGGTVNFNVTGPLDATPAHTTRLVQTGGTVGGNDVLEITERFAWHGGTQTDNGETRITSGATLELTGGSRTLSGKRTLFNQGLITWTVPGTWSVGGGTPSGATIRNAGTFEFRDGQAISSGGGEVQFLNVPGGLVTKIGAPGGQTANWSGEDGAADPNGNAVGSIPGWTRVDNFTVVPYGAAGFPSVAEAPAGAGANFFAGGPANAQSRISQTLDVSGSAASVDAGEFTAVLEGELGGTGTEDDAMTVHAVFLSGTTELGRTTIGPVLAADRGNVTGFVFRSASTVVPTGTRTIRLEAIANRAAVGSSYNNAYADKVRLRVRDLESFAGGSTIDIPFDNDASASGVDVAHGTLNVSGGDVNDSVGQFDVADGAALQFGGGTHDLASAASLDGLGTVRVTSGAVNSQSGTFDVRMLTVTGGAANLSSPSTVDVLRQSGGSVGGSGVLTLTGPGASTWTSGQMLDSGTTAVLAGVTLNLSGTGTKTLRRTLDNAGTVTWSGTGEIHTGNVTVFDNSGLFDIQNNQTYHHNHGGVSQLNNTGTLRKSAGTGTSDIDPPVDNDGTVDVQTGTLSFDGGDGPNASTGAFVVPATLQVGGGTYDLAAASSVSGAGTVRFAGGTTNVNGSYDLGTTEITNGTGNFESAGAVTDVFNQSGGILGGAGVLTMTGPGASSWTSGQMLGSGTTAVPSGVTLNLSGTGTKTLRRTLDNAGTVTWSGTGEIHTGNVTVFNNSGLFDIQNNQTYHHNHGGVSQLNNTGTLRKSAGTGISDIDPPVDNDGTVDVQVGTLSFDGGDGPNASTGEFLAPGTLQFGGSTYDLAAASSVTGAGTVRFAGGTTNVSGAYDFATTEVTNGTANFNASGSVTDVLNQSGGVVGGSGVFTLTGPGASAWTGGQMLDSGTTAVLAGVTLNLSGTGTKTLRRTLDNAGTVTWSGTGEIHTGNVTVFDNSGLFDIQNNQTYHHNHGGVSQLNNTGTLRKSAGTGTTRIDVPFDNTGGTLEAQVGTVHLNGAFANYNATTDILTGGAYVVQDTLRFNNADVVTNNAKVVLDGAASKVLDQGNPGLDAFRRFATNGPDGDFSIVNGRNLFTEATRGPDLANQGLLRGAGTYFQNVTNSGTVAPGASTGILTVNGTYTQSAAGTLEIEVAGTATAGTDYDRLVVTGTADLDGTLAGKVLGAFTPVTGVGIDVVTAAPRSDTFATVASTPSPLPGSLVFEARYDPTTVQLFAVPGGGAADDSVAEAAGTKTITVTLSAPSSEQVTVDFATADGSAEAGTDFQATSGTLTFAPNDTSETFDVTIIDDPRDEPDQTFLVNLSSASNTVLTDDQATITIVDDDAAPSITIADVTKAEGSSGTTAFGFAVALSGPSEKTITVDFATADGTATDVADYTAKTGTVTFAPGDTVGAVTVDVEGDTRVEPDENFFVDLSSPVNATIAKARGVGTILDDDLGGGASQLSIDDVAVPETDGSEAKAAFTVTLSPAPSTTVTVQYSTANGSATAGSDYTATSGTLTFEPTDATKPIDVPVTGDNLDEPDEEFTVVLSAATGASLTDAVGTATITDDDFAPAGNTEPSIVTDEDTPAEPFTLQASDSDDESLSFEVVSQPLHGQVALTAPGADTVDYTPDPNFNGFDTFTWRVSDGTNSDVVVTGIQVDPVNDPPVAASRSATIAEDTSALLTLSAADVEGDPLTFSVAGATNGTVSVVGDQATFVPAPNYHGPASFTFTANDGDLTSNVATVSLTVTPVNDAPTAGTDSLTVAEDSDFTLVDVLANDADVDDDELTVTAVSDPLHGTAELGSVRYKPDLNYNGPDTFTYTVSDGNGGEVTGVVNVTVTPVNDPPLARDDESVTVEGAPRTIDVLANDTDIDGDTLSVGAESVSEPEHGTAVVLDDDTIRYTPDGGFSGDDSFTYAADDGNGGTDTATVSVEVVPAGEGGAAVVMLDDASIQEGDSGEQVVDVTVRLSSPATVPVEVRVSTNNGTATGGIDYGTLLDRRVDFAVGDQSRTVQVKILGDTLAEEHESFLLVVSSSSGAAVGDGTAVVTINDDDPDPGLAISSLNVNEGNAGSHTALLTVALSAVSGKTVSVDYATADGTATQPTDYTPANGRLTFAPGETAKTVPVTIHGDTEVELDETLTMALSGAVNAGLTVPVGTITILNDDALGPVPPPPPAPPATPTADLALTMTGPAQSAVDRTVNYELTVRNNGPSAATGVTITDVMPAGLEFVSGTVGTVACNGTAVVTCPVGGLSSGAAATATIVAVTAEPGVHTNTASVGGNQPDPSVLNNSASVSTRVPVPVTRETAARRDACTLRGTPGRDVLRGTPRPDVICGLGGNDVLIGFGGNDRLLGGSGNDVLMGGPGNDILKGGPGRDRLLGGPGADRLDGGRGPDVLFGGAGNDLVHGSYGSDFLSGGVGKDRLLGGPGRDRLQRDARDVALGGPGRDRCLVAGVISFCP